MATLRHTLLRSGHIELVVVIKACTYAPQSSLSERTAREPTEAAAPNGDQKSDKRRSDRKRVCLLSYNTLTCLFAVSAFCTAMVSCVLITSLVPGLTFVTYR